MKTSIFKEILINFFFETSEIIIDENTFVNLKKKPLLLFFFFFKVQRKLTNRKKQLLKKYIRKNHDILASHEKLLSAYSKKSHVVYLNDLNCTDIYLLLWQLKKFSVFLFSKKNPDIFF